MVESVNIELRTFSSSIRLTQCQINPSTLAEVREAILNLEGGTAAFISDVPAELLKAGMPKTYKKPLIDVPENGTIWIHF